MNRNLKRFFASKQFIPAVASAIFVLGLNLLINVISTIFSLQTALIFMLPVMVVMGLIVIAFAISQNQQIIVRMGPAIALRTESDYKLNARKGLIYFIPSYNPVKVEKTKQLTGEQVLAAVENKDYGKLELEKSNFETAIKAITCHKSALRHCWLIATGGKDGSWYLVPLFEKYLQEQQGMMECKFHYGPDYQVSFEGDDTDVVEKTHRLIKSIFQLAIEKYNLTENDIIADITSGPRSMPLGMILACLDGTRDIEFIGTPYKNGKPEGKLIPMIFNFEPQLVEG